MAITSLISIKLSDHQDVFLVCSYKPAQKLRVILLDLDECKAFTGQATDLDMRSQAATIQMTFSDFVSLTRKALIQNEQNNEHFSYSLEKDSTQTLFKWKSVDEEETVVDIGSVKLIENEYGPMIKDVFLMLSKEMLTLNKKVSTLGEELSSVKKEKSDALQFLSEAVGVKNRVENELYSKFILVLNEKKQKIRELKQSPSDQDNAKSSNDKRKRSKVLHQISESSDEASCDVEKMDVPGPSTSKSNNSLLFLDDDDESNLIKISPSKRRNRSKAVVHKTVNLLESKSSLKDVTMDSESEDDLLNIL